MCKTVHELADMTQAQPILTGASYVMPVREAPFDVHAMRGHLEGCLEAGTLTTFPTCDVDPRRLRRKDMHLAVTTSGVEVV